MADLLNDYDVGYYVASEVNDSFYTQDEGKIEKKKSLILKITRSIIPTVKSLKWLRKNGFLSRWNYFRILFNKKLESSKLLIALCMILIFSSVIAGFFALVLWGKGSLNDFGFLFAMALVAVPSVMALLVCSFDSSDVIFRDQKIPQEFTEKTHQITIDQDYESLYRIVEDIKQHEFTHAEKEELFNIIEKYPYEVSEKIHKLMQLKEKLPTDPKDANNSSYSIFQDTDKMLDELFELRDSQENKAMLKKVESILNSSVDRQNLEKLGVSVEELSEVSEFLEKVKKTSDNASQSIVSTQQNLDVSEVMGSLNNTTDKEIVEEVPVQRIQSNTVSVS